MITSSFRFAALVGAVIMAATLGSPIAVAQGNVGDTPPVASDQAPPRTHHHRHRHHRHRRHHTGASAASRDGSNQ